MQCDARTTCELGCRATGDGVRCAGFDPQGPVTAADLSAPGLADLTLTGYAFDVTTGEIRSTVGGPALRQPNDSPTATETKNDITFRREGGLAIFVAKNISITGPIAFEGTQNGTIGAAFADLPVSLVAQGELHVQTRFQLPCGVLGGGAGGDAQLPGGGAGAGSSNSVALAGGGGGHGTAGPQGGNPAGGVGAAGGVLHNATFDFVGGGGGGGGAALQLVAGRALWIGDGVNADAGVRGIDVGGCGGSISPFGDGQRGGGGGAGGFLALEAPVIHGMPDAGIAANGGAGSGFGNSAIRRGERATLSTTPALGGGAGQTAGCHGFGGNGGAGTTEPTRGSAGAADCKGGGSGGAVGRIRIASTTGEITLEAGATPFFVSPSGAAQVKKVLLTAEP